MIKILFVCHGNICRSPMAEFVMKDMAAKAGLSEKVYAASAAVSREEEGNPLYGPARRELDKHNVPWTPRRARRITSADLREFDRIYYMDGRNLRYLRQLFPGETKFQPFLPRDVADPYYSGDFAQTWEDICEGCRRILEEIQ